MVDLYSKLIRPAMFGLDAEAAHEFAVRSLQLGLSTEIAQRMAARRFASESFGPMERFGLKFANPLGVAAGFDKNGIVVNHLAALGFGFVEVGTVTFQPQKGNEKPRLFRLPEDEALINRLGFNNDGAALVARRLKELRRQCVVGVNIGRNKDVPNEETIENYLASFDLVYDVADYVAVNVSSPNTPGLRDLQQGEKLEELLKALQERNRVLSSGFSRHEPPEGGTQNLKPLLVKIAPDLSHDEIDGVVDVCVRLGISGIVATNTTTGREGLKTPDTERFGSGGLSGRPLANRSNEVIKIIHRHAGGKFPIIGVGGIFTADDAFQKIASGASLLQVYTGFVYKGPDFAREINNGLLRILKSRGFSDIDAAVGSEA